MSWLAEVACVVVNARIVFGAILLRDRVRLSTEREGVEFLCFLGCFTRVFVFCTCRTVSEYRRRFSTLSIGVSFTGVPLISSIRSPMCNDIRSLFISSLHNKTCQF